MTHLFKTLFGGTLLAALTASGALLPVGTPMEGNSWGQRFTQLGVGSFDRIGIQSAFGSGMETPNLDSSGWAVLSSSTTGAGAVGSGVDTLNFTLWFGDRTSDPLGFVFSVFSGSDVLESFLAKWVPNKWTGGGWDICPTHQIAGCIPEPYHYGLASVVGLVALGLVDSIRRRRMA